MLLLGQKACRGGWLCVCVGSEKRVFPLCGLAENRFLECFGTSQSQDRLISINVMKSPAGMDFLLVGRGGWGGG